MILEHCLKLKGWQGPPNINKVKQHALVLFFLRTVCLLSLFRHKKNHLVMIFYYCMIYIVHH